MEKRLEDSDAARALAWCPRCRKLTARSGVQRFEGAGEIGAFHVYERSRCAVCGARQLTVTVRSDGAAVQTKVTFSSRTKLAVMRARCSLVARETGRSVSRVIEDAVEQYLYGPDGNWADDPLVDELVAKSESREE